MRHSAQVKVANKVTQTCHCSSLSDHSALEEALLLGEHLFAFYDDIYMVIMPERVGVGVCHRGRRGHAAGWAECFPMIQESAPRCGRSIHCTRGGTP